MTSDDRPASVADLCRITGKCEETVRLAIKMGQLPGYQVGPRGQYVIPRAAFDAFYAGTWVPQPRPLFPDPIKAKPQLLHTREGKSA